MTYLLDTNAISDLMSDQPKLKARLSNLLPSDRVVTCAIVRGEIIYGIQRMSAGRKRANLQSKADHLFLVAPPESMPGDVGDRYSEIKLANQRIGVPLDANDLWIAATAVALKAVLVTRDGDFKHVQGLTVEDWTA